MKYGSFAHCSKRWACLLTLALSFAGFIVISGPFQVAYAATIIVNTTADELNTNGNCSLREAIRAANLDINVDACTAGNGADTITLPGGIYTLAISGQDDNTDATGDLDITSNVTINGAGANTTIIDGNKVDRVIDVLAGATVIINKITIQNGQNGFACGAGLHNLGTLTIQNVIIRNNRSDCGGGIANEPPGILTVNQSTVTANTSGTTGGGLYNTAGGSFGSGKLILTQSSVSGNNGGLAGGGISNLGATTLSQSTVSGNRALDGGGILSEGSGLLTLTNSTVSDNTADRDGGGVMSDLSTLNNVTIVNNIADNDHNSIGDGGGIYNRSTGDMKNTLIANNTDLGGEAPDCSGTLNSEGYNLIRNSTGCTINGNLTGNWFGVDPLLGPLQNNGGSTETHALLAGSAAIDNGDPAGCLDEANLVLTIDQRGFPRPIDGNQDNFALCDIGAYEAPAASAPIPTATPTATSTASATKTNVPTPPTTTPTATSTATATNIPPKSATPTSTTTNTTETPTRTATRTATATSTDTPNPITTPGTPTPNPPTPTATLPTGAVSTIVQSDRDANLVYNNPNGDSVTVQIERGSVSQAITLVYTTLGSPQGSLKGSRFMGQSFTLVAYQNNLPDSQFNFLKPIKFTLAYTNSDVVGIEETQSMLYFYDTQTGEWSTTGITLLQRDTDNNRLIVTTTHLTQFATFAPFQPTSFYYLPLIVQK